MLNDLDKVCWKLVYTNCVGNFIRFPTAKEFQDRLTLDKVTAKKSGSFLWLTMYEVRTIVTDVPGIDLLPVPVLTSARMGTSV